MTKCAGRCRNDLEATLFQAGSIEVRAKVRESSRKSINEWLPGQRAGEFVASTNTTARKS